MIEVELNDYINDLVRVAHDEEARKLKAREFVDTSHKDQAGRRIGTRRQVAVKRVIARSLFA